MIFPSGIKEVGKSIVEHSERAQAASTVESTALRVGSREAQRGYPSETNRLHGTSHKENDRNLILAFVRESLAFRYDPGRNRRGARRGQQIVETIPVGRTYLTLVDAPFINHVCSSFLLSVGF